MPQNVLVTFEDISAMATRLRTDGGQIGSQLTSLLAAVQALVDSGWQGQAAGAFHGLYSSANDGWKEVETSLAAMADLLTRIATQYQEQEASIATSLAG